MAFPDCQGAVFRVRCSDDPDTFGTAFVVHVGPCGARASRAFLVTCAHVVDACEDKMLVADQPVVRVWPGQANGFDLAVVEVQLPFPGVHSLPLRRAADVMAEAKPVEKFSVEGFRKAGEGFRLTPLAASCGRFEGLDLGGGRNLRLAQIHLPEASVEPNELQRGYSGSPLLSARSVWGAVDSRGVVAGTGTYKLGSAFPLWHLPKIWPEMPDRVGGQLFGEDYWPILKAVDAQNREWDVFALDEAFRAVPATEGDNPEEYSLWGCAVVLSRLEDADQPTRHLRQFVAALAKFADRPDLVDVLPPLPPGVPPAPVAGAARAYRRLIIRIVEPRTATSRGERERGRRYEIEVHKATCAAPADGCCGQKCADCAPFAAGRLRTTKARTIKSLTLDESPGSGLRKMLEQEIQEILGLFGAEKTDLVQIVAPEALLPYLIFEAELDRIAAWGPTRLAVHLPTIFSGQSRSDRFSFGRDFPRAPEGPTRWFAHCVHIPAAKDDLALRQQLGGALVAVTGDRGVAEKCFYHSLPAVVVAWEDAAKVHATIGDVDCLRRLPRALYATRQPLSLVYDTPQVVIDFAESDFAEGEKPIALGH